MFESTSDSYFRTFQPILWINRKKTEAQLKRVSPPDCVDFFLMLSIVTWVLWSLKMGNFTVQQWYSSGIATGFPFPALAVQNSPLLTMKAPEVKRCRSFSCIRVESKSSGLFFYSAKTSLVLSFQSSGGQAVHLSSFFPATSNNLAQLKKET